jgi:Phage protein Gp19/Gp15/Gp42
MAYAELADLEKPGRFPRALTAAETAQAETMLEDASFLLSVQAGPGLDHAIEGGDEVITQAAMLLTVAMVRRALLAQAAQQTVHPGVDQISQTFGPYSSSVKYRSDDGSLWLYPSELNYLLGLLSGSSAAAVSFRSPGL